MTQQDAAREMGMHKTHVNQILSGRRNPGLLNANRIEQLTGIPASAWLPTRGASDATKVRRRPQKPLIGKAVTNHVDG